MHVPQRANNFGKLTNDDFSVAPVGRRLRERHAIVVAPPASLVRCASHPKELLR